VNAAGSTGLRSLFALYWASATASYLGDGVRLVAVPLLAASLSSAPSDVAIVSVAAGLPWLLFGLPAGVVADRVHRARMMTALQVVRGGLGLALVAGVTLQEMTIPRLAAVLFLLGACEVFYDIASHALLPAIVVPHGLQRANGRLVTAEVVVFETVGPAAGGFLFAAAAALPFAVDTASFLVSAALLLVVARALPATTADRPPSSVLGDLRSGWRWFSTQPLVLSLTVLSAGVNFAAGGFYAVFVLFSREDLGLGPAGYGLLIAASTIGSVAAGLLAERMAAAGRRRTVCLAVPPAALGFLALPAAVSVLPAAVLGLVGFGFTVSLFNVVAMTLRQVVTPNEMLGRVTALHRVACWGALPAGAALAGGIGDVAGVRAAIGGCAAAAAVLVLFAVLSARRVGTSAYAPEHADQ
jgi:MFS family permease